MGTHNFRFIISFLSIPVIGIDCPMEFQSEFANEEEMKITMPGLSIQMNSIGYEFLLYKVIFKIGQTRNISYTRETSTITIEGDLTTFSAKDFRRLIMHISKVALGLNGYFFIHAACILSPSDNAILLCGGSGSGKSSLALYLAMHGYKLISSDITLINNSIYAVGGTRHLTVYPAILKKWFSNDLKEIITEDLGFESKTNLTQDKLNNNNLFAGIDKPYNVSDVFIINIQENEEYPFSHEMDIQEKFRHSGLLNEDWTISTWISPSWGLFFPILNNPEFDGFTREVACRLMKLPHHYLKGDLEFCRKEIFSKQM